MDAAFFLNFGGGSIPVFSMSGIRKQRGKKAAASRVTNQLAADEWAAAASERPYALADLADADIGGPAWHYFYDLSLADTKKECAMHGLPITGAKYKLFDSLLKHARTTKFGNPKRGDFGQGTPPPPALKANDADKVRRALVADLRKGLVFDKKFKKGANKMLSAHYANCSAERESGDRTHRRGACTLNLTAPRPALCVQSSRVYSPTLPARRSAPSIWSTCRSIGSVSPCGTVATLSTSQDRSRPSSTMRRARSRSRASTRWSDCA
jgi:hypothetical protein